MIPKYGTAGGLMQTRLCHYASGVCWSDMQGAECQVKKIKLPKR